MKKSVGLCLALAFTSALVTTPLTAQNDPSLGPSKVVPQVQSGTAESQIPDFGAFGLQTQDYFLASTQFQPRVTAEGWHYASNLYFHPDSGALSQFETQILLPAGAHVSILECFVEDTDAANNIDVGMWKQTYHYSTDTVFNNFITSISSSGNGGRQKPFVSINETIKLRDGDDRNIYTLLVNTNSTSEGFRSCRLFWNRQVSPAPAVATFSDVPTSSPQFPFVEALVAAGITAGCGGGNYCPNTAITRGQMAVFVSAALGLHWPF